MIRSILSIITFPGVIFHELAHQIFCYLTGVKVFKVRYIRLGNPPGYVVHAEPTRFFQAFFIDVAPFILNSVLAILFFIWARFSNYYLLFIWLAVSAGMHCFPSREDAKNLLRITNRKILRFNFLAIVGYPVVLIIYIFNYLRVIWFDLIYVVILYGLSYILYARYFI